ncbi:MAG: GHKL domain-containing protein [Lachnospiraceae bacterium]|nr:GHKL domain-containing protein [Lachnospiraceae bacterium]
MELFLYVLADVLHFFNVLLVCSIFFSFQRRHLGNSRLCDQLVLVLTTAVASVMSAVVFMYDNDLVEVITYLFVMIILVGIFYREKLSSLIVVTLWTLFALSMFDVLIYLLCDIILRLIFGCDLYVSNLVTSILSLLMIIAIGKVYKKNNETNLQTIGFANLLGFTVLLVADIFVVSVIAKQPFIASNISDKRNLYLLAVVFVIIGIFIQLVVVIILFTQRNVYKEKEQILKAYLDEQKNHYEYLENREKETKKFRHDLRSHMELISNLIRNHEYEKIDNYIEQMHLEIDKFGNVVTVHNGIVDAIINQYYMKAKQNGIRMEVRGMFPTDCAIDTFDLCTIFSNALSNAYEAAIETEEKFILLECGYTDKNIIVVVQNSFNHMIKQQKNKDYHGFGLENIKDSVNKYDGFFNIKKDEKTFYLKIIFNYIGK